MKSVVLILSFLAPILSWASDNSCLKTIQNNLINNRPVDQEIAYEMGLTNQQIATYPAYHEQYTKDGTLLNYQIFLKTKSHYLQVGYEIKPGDSSTSNLFVLEYSYSVYDSYPRPIRSDKSKWMVKKDCSLTKVSSSKIFFQYQNSKGDVSVVEQSLVNEKEVKKTQKFFPLEVVLNNAVALPMHSLKQIRQSKFFNRQFPILYESNASAGLTPISVRIQEAPRLRRFNRYKNRIEDLSGIELALMNDLIGVRYYESKDSLYQVAEQFISHNSNFIESLSKSEWLDSILEKNLQFEPQSIGFKNPDLFGPSLRYEIMAPGRLELFNPAVYFKVEEQKIRDNQSRLVIFAEKLPLPKAIPWNAPAAEEDKKYLKGSHYIQLDKVQTIADELLPQLTGLNRLEASILIIKKMSTLMEYDHDSLDKELVTYKTTEEILQSRLGVCQHFSVLFTAIARALNIPSRILWGFYFYEDTVRSHSWIEFRINDSTWWPLDTQHPEPQLMTLNYFPIEEMSRYEMNAETAKPLEDYTEAALKEIESRNKTLNKTVFKKLPNP